MRVSFSSISEETSEEESGLGRNRLHGILCPEPAGDVIAILNDSGAAVVRYSYNGWGYETGHTTSTVTGLRLYQYNCLKYRGYYHDTETGFYYVSSRYYDPVIGRFISADMTDG